jgi:hypothetical protein
MSMTASQPGTHKIGRAAVLCMYVLIRSKCVCRRASIYIYIYISRIIIKIQEWTRVQNHMCFQALSSIDIASYEL